MTPTPPPATRVPVQPGSVRERLMVAAEKLVALYGNAGASARAITIEAGQRHNSAIAYHFGSRRQLMESVWTRGSGVVNAERRRIMAGWTDEPTLEDLVEVYVRPFTACLDRRRPS